MKVKNNKFRVVVCILSAIIILMVLFYFLRFGDTPWKGTVFHYVLSHKEELKQLCDEGRNLSKSVKEDREYLRNKLGWFTIVKSVFDYSDGQKEKVEFNCGGGGFVGGSSYAGFYYSADDQPYGLEFDYNGLTETKDGVYEWKSDDRTHWVYTERICEKWFYYYLNWD